MSDYYGDYYEIPDGRMRIEHGDGKMTISFDVGGSGRVCGSCTLCCKLLPVPGPPLHKKAGERCRHQRMGKGCTIYKTRPMPCRAFTCRWLSDAETAGMPRPDKCHYVIDMQDDYIELTDVEGGPRRKVAVNQVWVDPAFRDAYKDPALRAYMVRQAEQYGAATIIRWSSRDCVTVFPPSLASDGKWHEERGQVVSRDADDAMVLREAER